VLAHDDFRRDVINTRWLETTLLPELAASAMVAIDG